MQNHHHAEPGPAAKRHRTHLQRSSEPPDINELTSSVISGVVCARLEQIPADIVALRIQSAPVHCSTQS
ncbi:hypothetical protein AAFF_G00162510 [Aldrovandia affinis]|uniref:Uncharacterized protein n=1 Tax=Aldrovandia affinis TaxID=143900 RepID=A0AAD7SZA2_9TELE|nr:hypothetical protein AAFF_G00162510 [Aldrovandia affinis]